MRSNSKKFLLLLTVVLPLAACNSKVPPTSAYPNLSSSIYNYCSASATLRTSATGGIFFDTGAEGWAQLTGVVTGTVSGSGPGLENSDGYLSIVMSGGTIPNIPIKPTCQLGVYSPTINLTGKKLRAFVYCPNGLGVTPYATFYLMSGGYKWEQGSWESPLTPGCWNMLTLNPTFSELGADPTIIRQIGVILHFGPGTMNAKEFKIDNIEFY